MCNYVTNNTMKHETIVAANTALLGQVMFDGKLKCSF